MIPCPHCGRPLTDDEIRRLWSAHNLARRPKSQRGGHPVVPRKCPHCAEIMGTMALRKHIPRCPLNKRLANSS